MTDVKYQVFVSSTYADLIAERQEVSRAVLDMGHIPAGMEMFPAADVEQLTYIKKIIDECDYYVLILGARYGSLDPEGVSFTEREYDYAVATGKTVLAFVHQNMDEIPVGKTDKDGAKFSKLLAFKEKVCTGRLVKFWSNPTELAASTVLALNKAFTANPQPGWVRGDKVPEQATVTEILKKNETIARLRQELAALTAAAPKFDDAAGLEHPLSLSYTYQSSGGTKGSRTVEITYAKFLHLVAPTLHTPGTLASAMIATRTGLKERHNAVGYNLSVKESEVQDALMHLVATGYIKMWPAQTIGGKGHTTGYQLTPKGAAVWQEMSYTKLPSGEARAD